MKTFIINLVESVERKEVMIQQLSRSGIKDYEFLNAVRGTKLTIKELKFSYNERKAYRHLHRILSLNEVGCALSHQMVYERMLKDHIDKALVFEDDVRLEGNFPELMGLLESLTLENCVVKLDCRDTIRPFKPHEIRLSQNYSLQHPLNKMRFTWGYYIDIQAAKNLHRSFYPIFTEADDWFAFRTKINLRALDRQMVYEIGMPSEIGLRSGVDRKKMPRLIRKIVRTYDDLISIIH